tara:strand:+ start:1080 stop:1979 length:900 start_codon:yes stop_codon:yes gene_type:complete
MQEEQKIQKPEENEVEVELEEKKDEKVEAQQEEATEEKKSDELEDYSANVKNRIDKLTRKMREEERQKESAIQFAESVKKENESLKTRLDNLDKGYLEEFNNRVQSQLESAKRALKDANESGDADKIVEAQANLAAITVEKSKITKPKVEKTEEQPNQQPVVPNQPQPIPPQPPQQAQNVKPDPKAEAWAAKNEWFGQDEVMTYASFGIHRRLVEDEGFDPTTDEYYSELDKRIAAEFPHKLGQTKQTGGSQKVVSATSSKSRNKGGKKTVRLSPSQVAMAKRLGVPLEEYAKYVRQEA